MPPVRLSLTLSCTSPYCALPLAGLQSYIPYSHIAAVFMLELVVLLLLSHRSTSHTYILVLFGPVKPELGVIPSEQENHSKEHLNFYW